MITFEPIKHKYTHNQTGQEYISVTTLIEKYKQPFDSDYWSLYKSIKDILTRANQFRNYKRAAGGWENVVEHYREFGAHGLDSAIEERQAWYLREWEHERDYACDLGSKFHNSMEGLTNHMQKIEEGGLIYQVSQGDILTLQGFEGRGMFTELLLFNEKYQLAGQADRVRKNYRKVKVSDYKTCKEIKEEPFMEQRMLEPLEELYDTIYNHILMQLSAYGWMLEQCGYQVEGLEINHVDRITGEPIRDYDMPYRPDLVEAMLEHYRNNSF